MIQVEQNSSVDLDRAPMRRALELAARGLYTTDPNPRVGCVLVRDGARIGEGWHERAGEAHAEVAALRAVRSKGMGQSSAQGATAYVTLEPCSHTGRTGPCVDALIEAGIRRVVCASLDPNPKVAGAGVRRLEAAGVEVSVGLLQDEARALNPGFFSRFERNKPFVRLKLAMSLDARTAPAAGGARWISSEASRADVQDLRARSSAVLTGAGTVRCDDPKLNVRLAYGPWIRQPRRVVLDAALGSRSDAQVFADGHAVVFAAVQSLAAGLEWGAPSIAGSGTLIGTARGVEIVRVPAADGQLDLACVLEELAAREVNELLVECGPRLAGSFLEAGLVDELIVYLAPTLLGADAAPLVALPGVTAERLARFEITDLKRFGPDIRLTLRPAVTLLTARPPNSSGPAASQA